LPYALGGSPHDVHQGYEAELRAWKQQQATQKEYERAYARYQADLIADEYVELQIVRLENRIQVRAQRFSKEGELLHSVRTMMARLDEAPEVLDRLALALHEGTSYEETATIDNLTSEETGTPVKRDANFIGGVKTGFVFPYSPIQRFDGFATLGFDARIESQSYFIEFGAGFGMPFFVSDTFVDDDRWQSGGLYSEIGFNGYLTETDISPYIGVGVSPRIWFTVSRTPRRPSLRRAGRSGMRPGCS
jgi:hypothetical protein